MVVAAFISPSVDTAMAKKKLGPFYKESCTGEAWNRVFFSLENMVVLKDKADIEDF